MDDSCIWNLGFIGRGMQVLRQLDADAQAIERELRLARAELEACSSHNSVSVTGLSTFF